MLHKLRHNLFLWNLRRQLRKLMRGRNAEMVVARQWARETQYTSAEMLYVLETVPKLLKEGSRLGYGLLATVERMHRGIIEPPKPTDFNSHIIQ